MHPALAARGHRGNYTPHCRRLPARRRGPLLPAPPPQTLKALCTQEAPFPLLPWLSGLARHARHLHRSPGGRCPGPARVVGIQSRGNLSSRFCPPRSPAPANSATLASPSPDRRASFPGLAPRPGFPAPVRSPDRMPEAAEACFALPIVRSLGANHPHPLVYMMLFVSCD